MLAINMYLRIHTVDKTRLCTYPYCAIKSVSLALSDSCASCYYQHEWVSQHECDAFITISVRYLRVNALAADRPFVSKREEGRERGRERPRRGVACNEHIRFQTEFKDILPIRCEELNVISRSCVLVSQFGFNILSMTDTLVSNLYQGMITSLRRIYFIRLFFLTKILTRFIFLHVKQKKRKDEPCKFS